MDEFYLSDVDCLNLGAKKNFWVHMQTASYFAYAMDVFDFW